TIPNREVKTVSADGTAIPSGRVGRRLARKVRASIDVRTFFLPELHANTNHSFPELIELQI
ncbi:hypothetical protein, partial [Maribacter sp. 2307UL18-2]|uniref:hypothetical protein n=1 Tax=Maribacter sp. 2307UL18-2 TaxID=3386274 RepID=UPI0039BD82DE